MSLKFFITCLVLVVALLLLPCVSYAGGCGGGGFNSFNSFSYQAAFAPQFVPVYQAPGVQATPVYTPAFAPVQFAAPAYSYGVGVQAQVFQRNVVRGQRAPVFRGRSVQRSVNVQRNVGY